MDCIEALEDYLEEHPGLQNRLENGGLMAAASAPVYAFSAYKTLNDYGLPRSFTKIGLWTLGLSLATGVLWSMFPQAKNKATQAHENAVFKQYSVLRGALVDNVNEHFADQQERMILKNRAEDLDRNSGTQLISYILSPNGERIPVYSKSQYGDSDYMPMMDFPDDGELGLHYQSMRDWRNAYQNVSPFDTDMTGGDWIEDYSINGGKVSGNRSRSGGSYYDADFYGGSSGFNDRPLTRVNSGRGGMSMGPNGKARLELIDRRLMSGMSSTPSQSGAPSGMVNVNGKMVSEELAEVIRMAADNQPPRSARGTQSNYSDSSGHLSGFGDSDLSLSSPKPVASHKAGLNAVRETVQRERAKSVNIDINEEMRKARLGLLNQSSKRVITTPVQADANLNTGRNIVPLDPQEQAVLRVKAGDRTQDPDFTANNDAVMLGFNNAKLLLDDDDDLADKAWEEEMSAWKSPPLSLLDNTGESLISRTAAPPRKLIDDDIEMRDEDYDDPFS